MAFNFVNIIGIGYVGKGIAHLCKHARVDFCSQDLHEVSGNGERQFFNIIEKLVQNSEKVNDKHYYFICVPTPSGNQGGCDTSIVQKVLDDISMACEKDTVVIIKSTMVPGSTRALIYNSRIKVFFCPEFLRQETAEQDILQQEKLIFGCVNGQENEDIKNLCKFLYPKKEMNIIFTRFEYAELMKYTINTYLAQKVIFFNEIYEICESLGLEYTEERKLFLMDSRIGESHTTVPGATGFGYGLACFPKEMRGMSCLRKELNLDNSISIAVVKRNEELNLKKV